jgi:hypothetical protein
MTWRRWQAARQLLSEEFVLAPERAAIAQARAEEDAKFQRSAEALRRVK